MRRLRSWSLALLCLMLVSSPAAALDIVLTNDDGFETENIQALHRALVDAGHDVVLVAPYLGQSGTGGSLPFLQPLFPTSEPSEGGLLPAGSFPIGPTTIAAKQFYVDSSPAAASLYGIDVLAPMFFGGPPDLVIAGPNEGNNLGLTTPHSGTLGATVVALNKGIPAIAVSADNDDETTAEAELIAEVTLRVVDALDGSHGIRLPRGTGLNVNIPDVDPGANTAADFRYKLTRVGVASIIGLQFYENLGDSPIAQAVGIPPNIGLPGTSVEIPYTLAHPEDTSSRSEGNVIGDTTVTVSPIDGTYEADFFREWIVRRQLRGLFRPRH